MSQLYFSRDVKVYIQTSTAIWEVPVLDGFSFSQATNSVEVTLNEMSSTAGISRRGRKLFNDSLAPAEWSFQTYARPFRSVGTTTPATPGVADATAGDHHAVEEVLWALAAGGAYYDTTTSTFKASDTGTAYTVVDGTDLNIDFAQSNVSALGTATIWFHFPADDTVDPVVYKITGCCVNEATLTFDIDGITTIDWSGMGTKIEDVALSTLTTALSTNLINEGTDCDATGNFIRNRLSTLSLVAKQDSGANQTAFPGSAGGAYSVVLTGGSVTISNNISFLTPSTLGCVNVPLGHVTGTRTVSGSIDCYLDGEGAGGSGQLFDDLISSTSLPTNSFALNLFVGGDASGSLNGPGMQFSLPTAHMEIPAHDIGDIISLNTAFHGLPSTIAGTNEVTITYKGA
tara:strand:- start:367 stop:1569 length:1203 start_codon:yes stop_codon:yes gene_type:complete